MKPAPFLYYAPATVDDAVALLSDLAPQDGRILAGGQSLVPTMAFRMARPAHLIDINGIASLEQLVVRDGVLSVSACVRHAAFHRPVHDSPLGHLMADVVQHIAHYPIRTRGTVCGSLANADPASEWCLVAATLDASMVARSSRGERIIGSGAFFEGIMATSLAEDELLTEVRIPLLPPDTRFGFYEFNRRAGDYAIAMALVSFRVEAGRIVEPRIGVGGAEAHPRRMAEAEEVLAGQRPEQEAFRNAAKLAADEIDPLEDLHTSAEYRRDLVRTVVRRALERAVA